jgi:hypothetical protein
MVPDAYFSKKPFVDKVLEVDLYFISRLRDDSVLKYKYDGKPTGKRGRPKKFKGRININDLDIDIFVKDVCNEELAIYSTMVYSHAFKRDIKIAVAVSLKMDRK